MAQSRKKMYFPRNILVTGGAGFIGSNFVVHMLAKYSSYKIVVLDKLSYCSNLKNIEVDKNDHLTFVKGDIQDADLVRDLLKTHNIDSVVHFAAETHVDNSFGNSVAFTQSNVVGTHVLLECMREHRDQVQRFIHVSTDEVYGSCEDGIAKTEHVALDPTNPYAATKAAAEYLVKSYRHSFGLPLIITRGNNVYGPRQYPEKLIPKFISRLERNMELPLHGNGTNKRSFVYVMDVAKAFDLILHQGILGETYNIGSHIEFQNIDVARALLKAYGLESQEDKYLKFVADRAFNDVRYFIDSSKLAELGWTPTVRFQEGIQATIKWYRENRDHWNETSMETALRAHPVLDNPLTAHDGKSNVAPNVPADKDRETYLIMGSRGWIGGMLMDMLKKQGKRAVASKVRMENREALERELDLIQPTHILNCAGVTGRPNVDWCEDHKEDTVRANVIGALTLCDVAKKRNIHVSNLATGCIFHYDDDKPWPVWDEETRNWISNSSLFTEESYPNFKGSWYSRTKGYVDDILKEAFDNVLTLRLRMPISDDLSPRNFITKISNYARIVNIPNSMSVLHDLLPLMLAMAKAKKTGIYNFTNPGVISHNQVMDLYIKYIDSKKTYKNFTIAEQDKILKAARSNNELCTKKLVACAQELGVPLLNIQASMEEVFKRMRVNLGIDKTPAYRFLVVGAKGWIGQKVMEILENQGKKAWASKVRMQNREALEREMEEIKPTHILNCAGVTGRPNVDWCEDNKERTVRCNVIGTLTLCDAAHERDIHVTNLATGCIFHYDKSVPMHSWDSKASTWTDGGKFTEDSVPNFTGSWYSKTKGYVDQILKDSFPNVLTLRLRMPISDDLSPRNFITKISNYERIVNIPNSMSVLHDLLPLMVGMAEAGKTGIFNFTNPGVVSHNQVMDLYIKYIDPKKSYKNFTIEEQDKILKAARSNNELCTKKLESASKELGIPLPHITDSLHGVYQRMKVNLTK